MEQNFGREKFMKDIKNTIFVITAAEEETPTVSEFDDRDEAIKYARKMDKEVCPPYWIKIIEGKEIEFEEVI